MQDHIRDLLSRFQYSQQVKETAVFCILFGGEGPKRIMADLDINNSYTLRSCVSLYQRKIETELITLPAMNLKQKQDVKALRACFGIIFGLKAISLPNSWTVFW